MNTITRARLIAAAAALVTVGLVVAVILLVKVTSVNPLAPTQKISLPGTLSSFAPYGTDTFLTTNTYSLVAYNYRTGQVKLISPSEPVAALGGIRSISTSADHQGIIFHASANTAGGVLEAQLKSRGLSTSTAYWWLFNVGRQTFTPLDNRITMVKFIGNQIYALSDDQDTGWQITTYDQSLTQTASIPAVSNITSFFAINRQYYLQTSDNQLLVTIDGIVNKVLAKDVVILATAGSLLVGTDKASSTPALITIDAQTGQRTTLDGGVVGGVSVSGDVLLYQVSSGSGQKLRQYHFSTHKSNDWEPGREDAVASSGRTIVQCLDTDAAVVATSSNHYFLLGKGLAAISSSATFGATPDTSGGDYFAE